MIQLSDLHKSYLEYEDLGNFTSQMNTALEPVAPDNAVLQKLRSRSIDSLHVMRAIMNASKKNQFTVKKAHHDTVRDVREQGVVNLVKAWSFRDTRPEQRTAAQELLEIINRIGTTFYQGYKNQSELLNRLFTELDKPENQARLELLGIVDWYDEWKEGHRDFETCVDESNDADEKELPQLVASFNTLYDCVQKVLSYLQIMVTVEPERYTSVLKKIDTIIGNIMTNARARQTRKENAREDDTAAEVVSESDAPAGD